VNAGFYVTTLELLLISLFGLIYGESVVETD